LSGQAAQPTPGDDYAVTRWLELSEASAVWFARTADVGHRLRLAELIALAKANQTGGVRSESIGGLLNETTDALTNHDLYVADRFPEVSKEASLMKHSPSAFVPGSAGHCAAEACLERLHDPAYLAGLVEAVVAKADAAGQAITDLRAVDALVELLDSELAHEGHSRTWRAEAALAVQQGMKEGKSLAEALPSALEDLRAGVRRDFEVVIPISGLGEPDQAPTWMQALESVGEVIGTWAEDGRAEAQSAVQAADRAWRYTVTTVDAESALRTADDRFRRLRNVWQLQGNDLDYPATAVIYDPQARSTQVRPLPSEPLDLAPDGLEEWSSGDLSDSLDDAIDQLAQARTARPSAAFVDLWTVAETLYGGGVEDQRYKAGLVMTSMAEYSYITDSHIWLARRADEAGVASVPHGGELQWLMEKMSTREGAQALDQAFISADDQLAWSRFKAMSKWDERWGLRNELDRLHARLKCVVDRAYLIRNFAVHRADASLPTLGVILPTFAGLVQTCVAMSLSRSGSGRYPLTDGKAAGLIVRAIADDFGHGRSHAPDGLAPALMDPRQRR
jgi:hypothetical protein